MKHDLFRKCLVAGISVVFMTNAASLTISKSETMNITKNSVNDETEYWALLIAVGKYWMNPFMDRPSMLREVKNLYDMLPISEWWDEDHIKIITGENATMFNIIKGFRWLDKMEDDNDISLIFLATHGFPYIMDFPPFDEEVGEDEALASYYGFLPFLPIANPFGILMDDHLNMMINRLESNGIGVIVDSCYSGGFDDIRGSNRVVVTSSREDEVSYGSIFTKYLIKGLRGHADVNGDGIVSLEEAFYYAEPRVIDDSGGRMHPQIFDDYPDELVLTEVNI